MKLAEQKRLVEKRWMQEMKSAFACNWKRYLQEALGLAIFMFSACFFGTLLDAPQGSWHRAITNEHTRLILTGILMGGTALFIFYFPLTAPSGTHINPAVTLSFMLLRKIKNRDGLFYILFQFAGGTIAVLIMRWLLGPGLSDHPVRFAVTIPKTNLLAAAEVEFIISFTTMSVILFLSSHPRYNKYTRVIAALLVCNWVIFAGPISGFGMNPARSFASAVVANEWTGFWIYLLAPPAGMLLAAKFFKINELNYD
jgi:aquaporin Z